MATYKTFIRSARNFRELATARKKTVRTGLSYEQALLDCEAFNNNRDPAQIRAGTTMEFSRD